MSASYKTSQTGSCPYCESEGPFIKILNVLIEGEPVRTYLECLVCGNTFIQVNVAHPSFWRDTKGNPPKPVTVITQEQVREGEWTPLIPKKLSLPFKTLPERTVAYIKQLAANNMKEEEVSNDKSSNKQ